MPPSDLLRFYRYLRSEDKRIFSGLFTCGFEVACANALVSVLVGNVVAFVGQTNLESMARVLAQPSISAACNWNCSPCADLYESAPAKQPPRYRRRIMDSQGQPLACGPTELAFFSGRLRRTSRPIGQCIHQGRHGKLLKPQSAPSGI